MPDKANPPPEPSMEEIIASISRIITEDKKPDEPMRPARDANEVREGNNDILELTEAVNEDGSVRRVIPSPQNTTVSSGESVVNGTSSMPRTGAPAEPAQREAGIEPKLQIGRERIVSTATSGAAAAAFAQLGGLPRERWREAELSLGASDRTLEDIVRDMLRPFLETWLNEHLPGIVERLVRQEIARVVGEAGLR